MTLADIQNRIYFFTNTSSSDFSDANMLISINNGIDKVQTLILRSQDEWDYDDRNQSNLPIITTSLVANQQDYKLPTALLKIKRAQITYDGTNWYRLNPIDLNEISEEITTTYIANNFNQSQPYYDIQSNSIFLYPIPSSAVVSGLKLWIDRSGYAFSSAELTAGTLSPGFDRQFHELIALYGSYDYNLSRGRNTETLKRDIVEFEQKLMDYYGNKQKDRELHFNAAYINYE